MTAVDNNFCTTWYKEKKELNDEQIKWLRHLQENCLKDIPYPDSGFESPLARSQPKDIALHMRTPQQLSLENITV